MKTPKAFDKHTFIEGFPILQPVTPTDDEHQAHWWHTDDGQKILAIQNRYFDQLKGYKDFQQVSKGGIGRYIEALNHQYEWPEVSQPGFWCTKFGDKIISGFWEVVNKFIRYLNTLE